jgi:sugar-specific transcriptional regulator TrmB
MFGLNKNAQDSSVVTVKDAALNYVLRVTKDPGSAVYFDISDPKAQKIIEQIMILEKHAKTLEDHIKNIKEEIDSLPEGNKQAEEKKIARDKMIDVLQRTVQSIRLMYTIVQVCTASPQAPEQVLLDSASAPSFRL